MDYKHRDLTGSSQVSVYRKGLAPLLGEIYPLSSKLSLSTLSLLSIHSTGNNTVRKAPFRTVKNSVFDI